MKVLASWEREGSFSKDCLHQVRGKEPRAWQEVNLHNPIHNYVVGWVRQIEASLLWTELPVAGEAFILLFKR